MEFAQTKLDSANAKTSCSLALGVSMNGPVTRCKCPRQFVSLTRTDLTPLLH